jgi:hypothetical protein
MCYYNTILYDDDEVRYILQDIEDSMDKKRNRSYSNNYLLHLKKKIELARFEDQTRQVKNKTYYEMKVGGYILESGEEILYVNKEFGLL